MVHRPFQSINHIQFLPVMCNSINQGVFGSSYFVFAIYTPSLVCVCMYVCVCMPNFNTVYIAFAWFSRVWYVFFQIRLTVKWDLKADDNSYLFCFLFPMEIDT